MYLIRNLLKKHIPRATKVQFVSRDIPVENTIGNATYILDFLRYLRQTGCEIEYVLLNSSPNGRVPWYIIPPVLATLANVSAKNNLRIGRLLVRFNPLSDLLMELVRSLYNHLPENLKDIYRFIRGKRLLRSFDVKYIIPTPVWDALATPEEVNFASLRFVRFKPNLVIANYAFLGGILDSPALDKTVLRVIITHDVRHQRFAHFKKLKLTASESNWSWEQEATQLSKAQILLAIQEEDAKLLKQMVPHSEVISMPKAAIIHDSKIKQVFGRCLFVGSGVDHNYYGLKWFLENVWLKVTQLIHDSSLHVCGTVCDLIQESFPNVHLLGRVDDLEPEYGAAEVCLVPLLAGSGLKIKLVEAMSYGRACVSTSVGVQGLGGVVDSAVLVADTPEDFAAAIHTVLTNKVKRQWMEEEAHRYAIAKLSPQAAYQPFVDYIHQHLQQVQSIPKIVDFEETMDLEKIMSSNK
ncbi:MAG: glycosyltransferase family 4 protein [Fischerella sp. CENA71]|nr:glycosyltransferase family 4 protein [Fischerella sp. CENA71]